ncbi:MAG: phosphoribosylformylglycinamidine synthase [Microgenomates group bacterium Gr01-1014_7]|nr:MAG: phosphoribosylformylglycinamidine synthase [Microgenomates group bacterium Gr01-1014_7]
MAETNEGDLWMKTIIPSLRSGLVSSKEINVCILQSDGTNCDVELFYAFKKFGGNPQYVHVNELRSKDKTLKDFQILALPGGFSYGDDIASGKILAIELISFLKQEIERFGNKGGLVIGICNGFQTLVRTGLLPFGNLGKMDVTLAPNDSGHFECRWIKLKLELSKCAFLKVNSEIGYFSVNHGEGKFFSSPEVIKKVEDRNLVVFRYVDDQGKSTQVYPDNPNGSLNAIAGVTDPTGRIFGMMPHPEKFVDITQYPNWRREKIIKPHGAFIFEDMINYVRENL